MSVVVEARHMSLPDDLREYVEDKADKLSRFLADIQTTEVILDVEGEKPVVEIVVTAKRKATFVASHRDDDMQVAIDQCLHKISEQLRRHKDKIRDRQGPPHGQES